ncbi:YqiJ family protein [Sphingorhabdus sp. Alg239-R122]|uniref:YqiJ family protein n=1 Tax=Sphingorhabdus sp. Alg239-R122 TaxID=2305989 RepID=UPI0013DBC930|nr:YqiJ family protein [Sphingorhabdus sp. Alg239-R122]
MFDFWLLDENLIFTGALLLMIALGVLQAIGLGDLSPDLDVDLDIDMDMDADFDASGPADGLLAMLGLGRLPLMMLLVLFLALFGMIGLAGQQFIENLTGALLSPWLAAPIAAVTALPLTGLLSRPLSRIIPQDETTAVNVGSLIGRFAVIQTGRAQTGSPARAKVTDVHGHHHYIMVEPDNAGQILNEGEEVLLTAREGRKFRAISRGNANVPQLGD